MRDEEPWLTPEEAGCRLLLHLSPSVLETMGLEELSDLLALPEVAGLVIETEGIAEDRLRRVAATAEGQQRACLLVDAMQAVARVGAHGLHLRDWKRVSEARRQLGAGWILGASCGLSRHAAMVAGEGGADYVLFGELGNELGEHWRQHATLVVWWAELFYLPCAVALGTELAHARAMVREGADFLVPTVVSSDGTPTSPRGIRELASELAAMHPRGTGER